MPAPPVVLELVARFRDHEEAYRRDYGETETRREFLDPFFKALGWDIDNTLGHAEEYKDVVHEDTDLIRVKITPGLCRALFAFIAFDASR